jgi:hypothetical protein
MKSLLWNRFVQFRAFAFRVELRDSVCGIGAEADTTKKVDPGGIGALDHLDRGGAGGARRLR